MPKQTKVGRGSRCEGDNAAGTGKDAGGAKANGGVAPMESPRRARVTLTRDHIHQLIAGDSLTIRLRTFNGEAQLVELVSPLPHSNQKDVSNMMKNIDSLLSKLDGLGIKVPPAKGGKDGGQHS